MTPERDHTPDRNLPDGDDPILDVCLAELLGGQAPPDLSARIVAAVESRRSSSTATPRVGLAPIPLTVGRPTDSAPVPVTNRTAAVLPTARRAWPSARRAWLPAALAASLLAVALGYGLVRVWTGPASTNPPTAASPNQQRPDQHQPDQELAATTAPDELVADGDGRPTAGTSEETTGNPTVVADHPTGVIPTEAVAGDPQSADPQSADPVETAVPSQSANEPATAVASTDVPSPAPSDIATVSSDEDVIAYINELVRQRWREAGVSPSAAATDAEWCRRLYLDVLGRIPTAAETMRFVNDRSRGKRPALVNRLLDSDEYLEEYARNWTTLWTNILIGRSGGTEQGTLVSRDGLQQYLRRSFLKNKPYDQMTVELVSAEGVNTPGQEGFNGAVNFLLHNLDENATPATAKTARIFLGLQVQCTQCHCHPFNEWKQSQFWELNAFFRQCRPQPLAGQGLAPVALVDQDTSGEGTNPKEAEIYYEERRGVLKVAYPVFVDGTRVDPSGFVSDVNRRDELARLIVGSEYLPRAVVNRLWGHFLGFGFTKPIDDMGPHNPPSHPELLERLGRDFAGHGYDLKQLTRWITLSEPYSLSSRVTPKNETDNPALGVQPLFSHFYLRQMRAEELYQSLLIASGAQQSGGGDYAAQERRKTEWLSQFTIAFGTDEGGESTSFNGTIPQTLMMWNGDLIQKATSGDAGTYLHTVATNASKSNVKIDQLFLTAFARKPTASERRAADELWRLRGGDPLAALQDIWWVVLNSNEFIFNH